MCVRPRKLLYELGCQSVVGGDPIDRGSAKLTLRSIVHVFPLVLNCTRTTKELNSKIR